MVTISRPSYAQRDRIFADIRNVRFEQEKTEGNRQSYSWHLRMLSDHSAVVEQIVRIKENKRWTLGQRVSQLYTLRELLVILAATVVGWIEQTDRLIAQEGVKSFPEREDEEV